MTPAPTPQPDDGTTPDDVLEAWRPNVDGISAPWSEGDCGGHEQDGERTRWCYCRRNRLRFPVVPQPAHDHGAAGFCTDHGHAPDERTETVARVLVTHCVVTCDDMTERCWCGWSPTDHAPTIDEFARHQADMLRAVMGGVGAGFWPALAGQNDRDAWTFMAERDAARAALDRVRALHKPVWDGARDDYRCAECGAALNVATPDCPSIAAALDPEEPR